MGLNANEKQPLSFVLLIGKVPLSNNKYNVNKICISQIEILIFVIIDSILFIHF